MSRMDCLLVPKIGVFWDVDDYPAMDIVSFANNVKTALKNVGYSGDVYITAYGTKKPDESMRRLYNDAGITFAFKASKRAKVVKMLTDMFRWDAVAKRAGGRADGLATCLLISKGILSSISENPDRDHGFRLYVSRLHSDGPNMLYVVPDGFQPNKFPCRPLYRDCKALNCVWYWSDLLAGGKPLVVEQPSMIT